MGGARLLTRTIAERPERVAAAAQGADDARRRRRIGRADGGPRASAQSDDRGHGDRLRRRRPAQAGDAQPRSQGARDDGRDRRDPRPHLARRGRDRDPVGARAPCAAKVVAACRERGIAVRTLPTVFELLRGGVQLTRQLREVQVEDVLGREPVVMELDRVGAYVEDQVVLVTGAGGSIGSELLAPDLPGQSEAADPARPLRGRAVPDRPRADRAVAFQPRRGRAGRLQGGRPDARGDAALQARRRLPRRRLQARAADGGEPARGRPQQRDGYPDHSRDRRRRRRPALRLDLDRQGGQPAHGDGRLEGDGRVDRRVRRASATPIPGS